MGSITLPDPTLRIYVDDLSVLIGVKIDAHQSLKGSAAASDDRQYWSLDLHIYPSSLNPAHVVSGNGTSMKTENSPPLSFLKKCIDSVSSPEDKKVVRFIFSSQDGFIIRSDILERRFECCELVKAAVSFTLPLQELQKRSVPSVMNGNILLQLLPLAIGGLELANLESDDDRLLLRINQETENRLSIPWISPTPIQRRRIAWVQGREDIESSRRAYEAAKALGISLVVLENPGHWLEDDAGPHAHLREAFIPMNIEVDDGFPLRIVKAVREYVHKIDGVVSISDVRLPGVAKASEILGLPTSSFTAYEVAGNKAKTRLLEDDSKESFVLPTADHLARYLQDRKDEPLQFPLIVKPCLGWSSDCVAKVTNEDDLIKAVHRASDRHRDAPSPSTAVIVEPYIDGPEVDANFVLLDGKILFFDINDDFPSRGDEADAKFEDNFQETQNVFPTALPADEVTIMRDTLHKSILRQGFSTGVFHCEARVRYSKFHYVPKGGGVQDLEEKETPPSQDCQVYLLEINARPPGYLETVAVLLTYGVDYYAIRLLLAIGPEESARVSALSQPFVNGAQFHLSAMIIPQTRAGIMKSADAAAEFLLRFPELHKQIPDYKSTKKASDILDGPAANSLWWIAYFSVFSRKSREDLLNLVRYIEQNFTYEVV